MKLGGGEIIPFLPVLNQLSGNSSQNLTAVCHAYLFSSGIQSGR